MEVICERRNKSRTVGKMISLPELRRISRERKLALDLMEKDYAIGWFIFGISSSSLYDELVFNIVFF